MFQRCVETTLDKPDQVILGRDSPTKTNRQEKVAIICPGHKLLPMTYHLMVCDLGLLS